MEFSFQRAFSRYIINVSEVNGFFNVLVKKPRGKILGGQFEKFIWRKFISERIYKKFAEDCNAFLKNYFPYFKLVRCYGNYHYHFLVVRKDYHERVSQNIVCFHQILTTEFVCLYFFDASKKTCSITNAVVIENYTLRESLCLLQTVPERLYS